MDEPYAWIRELDLRAIGEREAHGRRGFDREHSSERGWQQHRYRHERPCDACRRAHVRYNLERSVAS